MRGERGREGCAAKTRRKEERNISETVKRREILKEKASDVGLERMCKTRILGLANVNTPCCLSRSWLSGVRS